MLLKENERLDNASGVHIIQNKNGYCFTSDALLLANFCKLKKDAKVVDLCSGSGVVGILVHVQNKAKCTYLVEIQHQLASMSERSIEYNALQNEITVLNQPLQNVYEKLGKNSVDAVVCNPPYKKRQVGIINDKEEIALAKHEIKVTLEEIICESAKLLKFGGCIFIINKEERLAEIIYLMKQNNIEPKLLQIKNSNGQNLVLVNGVRGGKSGIKIIV